MRESGRVGNTALLALGVAGLGAAAAGVWFYTTYNATVYWNLGANSHRWYYIHPTLYAATALVAIMATIAGARGTKSPARPLWVVLPWVLAVLILLTLWASASTALGRAYEV